MAWWYLTEGQPTGPVDDETIRAMAGRGELAATSLVYRDEAATWADLSSFEAHLGLTRNALGHYVIPVVDTTDRFPLGEPAGALRRIAARLVDAMVLRFLAGIATVLLVPWAMGADQGSLLGVSIVVGTVLTVGYEALLVAVRGQTVGKSMLGIEVVDAETGTLLSLPRSLLRALVAAVGLPVSALMLLLPGRPTLHDLAARSRVQRAG